MSGSLLQFAEVCDALAATTKKLEKRAIISNYLRALSVDDACRAALYIAGMPFPETDRRALNAGGSLLEPRADRSRGSQSRRHARRLPPPRRSRRRRTRPARTPAKAHPPSLTLEQLEDSLTAIAAARGPAAKIALVLQLLRSATPVEAKYILKLISGDMRIGVKQSLVEEAIAAAYDAEPVAVRHAAMLTGSLPEVVAMAATHTLGDARMKLFHPARRHARQPRLDRGRSHEALLGRDRRRERYRPADREGPDPRPRIHRRQVRRHPRATPLRRPRPGRTRRAVLPQPRRPGRVISRTHPRLRRNPRTRHPRRRSPRLESRETAARCPSPHCSNAWAGNGSRRRCRRMSPSSSWPSI